MDFRFPPPSRRLKHVRFVGVENGEPFSEPLRMGGLRAPSLTLTPFPVVPVSTSLRTFSLVCRFTAPASWEKESVRLFQDISHSDRSRRHIDASGRSGNILQSIFSG